MKTFKYYRNGNYFGWNKANRKNLFSEVLGWLRSDPTQSIIYEGKVYTYEAQRVKVYEGLKFTRKKTLSFSKLRDLIA